MGHTHTHTLKAQTGIDEGAIPIVVINARLYEEDVHGDMLHLSLPGCFFVATLSHRRSGAAS